MDFICFTEEQKRRANNADLVEFLFRKGEKLIPSGRDKRLVSDKSITVRGSEWYDHANQQGGHAIDFVQDHFNMSFPEAVTELLGGEQGQPYTPAPPKQAVEVRKEFALPPANSDMRRVYAYLLKQRCIDREVLTAFAKEKLIYEDAEHHNAVFVGMDENGIPRHAHQKSTNSLGGNFRINTEGSDPAYSFHFISKNPNPHFLFVFEAPIDMLSYISLHQKNWQNASYVALNGVSERAILKLLEVYPRLNHVVLCLDHDAAGIEASEKIYDSLTEKGHYAVGMASSKCKDWNEDLKAEHGISPLPAEEHPQQLLRNEICCDLGRLCAEKKNADCSVQTLRNLFEHCRTHLQGSRFDQANECLREMMTRSLLAAAKEYRQMGNSRDLGTVQTRLSCGFKTYENRGKLKSRIDDMQQAITLVFGIGKGRVITQTEKLELAEGYEKLAGHCLKAVITMEISQQKLEQTQPQVPEMTMMM